MGSESIQALLAVLFWGVFAGHAPDGAASPREDAPVRRVLREQQQSRELDSCIVRRSFQFLPVTLEWLPHGGLQYLTDYYFYLSLQGRQFQMHLPVAEGYTSFYNAMIDAQTDSVADYSACPEPEGWKISFSVCDTKGRRHLIVLTIEQADVRTVVDLVAPHNVMQYTGTLVPNRGVPHVVDPAPLGGSGAVSGQPSSTLPCPAWQ